MFDPVAQLLQKHLEESVYIWRCPEVLHHKAAVKQHQTYSLSHGLVCVYALLWHSRLSVFSTQAPTKISYSLAQLLNNLKCQEKGQAWYLQSCHFIQTLIHSPKLLNLT